MHAASQPKQHSSRACHGFPYAVRPARVDVNRGVSFELFPSVGPRVRSNENFEHGLSSLLGEQIDTVLPKESRSQQSRGAASPSK